MPADTYHLEWNNHIPNIKALLESMYTHQSLVDVTICCHDGMLKAHKIILSACSPYFESVFKENPCKHPILILKGISVREMQAILKFMYRGSVDIQEDELVSLVSTAHEFKVKGFAYELESNNPSQNTSKDKECAERNKRKNSSEVSEQKKTEHVQKNTGNEPEENIEDKIEDLEDPLSNKESNFPVIVNSGSVAMRDKDPEPLVEDQHESDHVEGQNTMDSMEKQLSSSAVSEDSLEGRTSTPYARETRFKGLKRVSVGFRLNRTKSAEKREQESKNLAERRENDLRGASAILKKLKSNEGSYLATSSVTENGKRDSSESSKCAGSSESYKDNDEISVIPDITIKEETDESSNMFCISALQEGEAQNSQEGDEVAEIDGDVKLDGTVCPFCYLDCGKEPDLQKHIRSHTGEKQHQCDFCALKFVRASHLARHRRTHTGERPFDCPTCGRKFARQDKLKQHINRHDVAMAESVLPMYGTRHDVALAETGLPMFGSRHDGALGETGLPMFGTVLPGGGGVPVMRRGRGRPRRGMVQQPPAKVSSAKRRGRPRKALQPTPQPVGPRRGPGRPRKIHEVPIPAEPSSGEMGQAGFASPSTELSGVALPFGDTSYLSSLSLGQQRYNDLTICPIMEPGRSGPGQHAHPSQSALPEDLLKSVRQLGECTIQAFPGQAPLQ